MKELIVLVFAAALCAGQTTWTTICNGTASGPGSCAVDSAHPNARGFISKLPYDPFNDEFLYYTGSSRTGNASIYSSEIWGYQPSTSTFIYRAGNGAVAISIGAGPTRCAQEGAPASTYNPPAGHPGGYFDVDTIHNKMFATAQLCGGYQPGYTAFYDLVTHTFGPPLAKSIFGAGDGTFTGAPTVTNTTLTWVGTKGIYCCDRGGATSSIIEFNGIDAYTDVSAQVRGTPPPAPLTGFGAVQDGTNLWIIGGCNGAIPGNSAGNPCSGAPQNDIYRYNVTTKVWTKMSPVGGVKPPTTFSSYPFVALDTTRNRILWYAADNDLWSYSIAANQWTHTTTTGGPSFGNVNDSSSLANNPNGNVAGYHAGTDKFIVMFVNAAGGGQSSTPAVYELAFGPAASGSGVTSSGASITTTSLPSAPKGLSYSQTLTATGNAPITWSIVNGSLPAGLSLNSSTGAITGTATTLGVSAFTVQAANASGTDTKSLTIAVRNPNVPVDYATFQAGLNGIAALGCGSTLTVNAGVYTENVIVPASNCTFANPITVQVNGAVPPPGVRITPNYLDPTPRIPVLQGAAPGTVLKFTFGDGQSNGWVFRGIGVNCSLNAPNQICVEVGTQDWFAFTAAMAVPLNATSHNLPTDIAFDHCILRGSRVGQARVGMQLNGQNLRVVDSWLGDLWDYAATDGQAIRSLSGDGPIDIINTYLDAQTETLGVGATGSIITTPSLIYGSPTTFLTAGSIPDNITVDHSHLTHGLWLRYDGMNPYTWTPGQLTRMGQVWIAYTNNDPLQARIGVYQATNMGTTGSSFPKNFCTDVLGCTFGDGTIIWRAISNFAAGETYIGPGIAKNLAECKQCGAWTIKRSFLQHAWEGGGGGGAQGFALTFSHRTNVAPYSVMGPITFKDNIIDDVAGVLQASAFGDDADGNIYPTVRSSMPGPYIITAANNTLVIDGTTITLTTGTRTAADVAEEINAALPHLTVVSVAEPREFPPYWTKYTLTLSGNVSFAQSYDAAPILAAVRNGITRTDLGQSMDNISTSIVCTWDSLYNGGAGRTICDGTGQNQVELMYPYGARIAVASGATISIPTVASSYHDASTNGDYLMIVKGQYFTALTISGPAAAALGLPATTTLYCTHPITRQWYACGVSKGLTFVNNLITNASTATNKFASWRSPYLIWPSNIHPLEISHNTFDYQYGTAFVGQGVPNSGAIRNNVMLYRNAASSGETAYFGDGRQTGLSWIHSYLCPPPLDAATIATYQWMANGTPLPACPAGVASGNILPGATVDAANETLPSGSLVGSSSAVPKSSINAPVSAIVLSKDGYSLAAPGTRVPPIVNGSIYGAYSTTSLWNDSSVELGIRFKSDVDGNVTGVRYYKVAGCAAATTGSLWAMDGTQLATGVFGPAADNSWTTLTFTSPVAITAGTPYIASFHTTCIPIMSGVSTTFDNTPLHSLGAYFAYGASAVFPNTANSGTNYSADIQFTSTGRLVVGQAGTIGSAQAKAPNDHTDAGVDTSKLPLIRNLQVTYSDRAAIISWLDSEVSRNIPGVLRLCDTDPDYNPTCPPAGSIGSADAATGAIADNSDNDSSPKNGLQRYIVVTGLAPNTKYYAQLYRGGHYRAFSFTTMAALSGSVNVSFARTASASMGPVANMVTTYGATYSRLTGVVMGSAAPVACSPGTTCSAAVTAPAGAPLYLQPQMRDSGGKTLYSYPVSVTIPGGATVAP